MALLSTVLNEQAASAARHIRVELCVVLTPGTIFAATLPNHKSDNYLTFHTFVFIRCCKYATSR
jgi:hypothetical protein